MNENKFDKNVRVENKLGVMSIKELVLNMSTPLIISMLIQGLYNLVDSFFVARIPEIGQSAITALALSLPLQMLIVAVTVGTGIGINSLLSRKLGEKEYETANFVVGNAFILWAFFIFIGVFFIKDYFDFQTSNQLVINLGISYLSIIVIGSGTKIFQIFLTRILQGTGMSKLAMISQGSSAILNIILDPIFIFYFDLGVKGAAIATILAQFLGGIAALYLNFKYNKEIEVNRKFIKFDITIVKAIYAVGIPSIIMQTVRSFTIFGINFILAGISEIAVTAYGIFFKIQQLILMPGFGLSSALIPIVAYNYGAKKPARIKKSIIISLKFGISLMLSGALILEVFPSEIFGIFNPSPQLLKVGIVCIRIIAISFVFVIVNIIFQSSLQALGYGKRAMYLSLFRTVFIMLPAAFLLAKTTNAIDNVWWAFVICEIVAMFLAIIVFLSSYKTRVLEQNIAKEKDTKTNSKLL